VFIVIQDQPLLQRLSNLAKPLFMAETAISSHILNSWDQPDANIFYNASTLIVIGSFATGQFVTADCWLAAENLMLTACSMGLGSCVIGSALPIFNMPEIKAEFGIPAEYSAIAPIIIGYPSGATVPVSRNDPVVLSIQQSNGCMSALNLTSESMF